MQTLTREQFDAIKADAPAGCSLRYHGKSAPKYAQGTLNIAPRGAAEWTTEEFAAVWAWVERHGLRIAMNVLPENRYYCHKRGINYMGRA
jgi:hypothetical protein